MKDMTALYTIRRANLKDITFLIDVILAAEKSNSEKLSFSTLFDETEVNVKHFLACMLNEEVDGCEISVSSFLIVEYGNKNVAAFGGWIEDLADGMSSKILKSNLISYYFGKESILHLKTKAHLIKDILIEREEKTLQLEYLYVENEHRGKNITKMLIEKHIEEAKNVFTDLNKVQVQVFKNNIGAIKVYQNCGFTIVQSFKVNDNTVLDYLPFNEKYLMERILNN